MSGPVDRRSWLCGAAVAMLAPRSASLLAAPRQRFFERVGKPIGLQIYSLGDDIGRDLDGNFAQVAAIGYRDVEFARLLRRTPSEIRAAADRAGLVISSVHLVAGTRAMPGSVMLNSSDQLIADTLGTLGARQAVVPMFALPDNLSQRPGESSSQALTRLIQAEGEDFWKRTAALLNERAAALKRFGISLSYHNHNLEFAAIGNTTGWAIVAWETDPSLVGFEIDLGWVAAAGLDVLSLLQRHRGRVRAVHVKDLKASTVPNFAFRMDPAEVGAGSLDWERILPAAHAAGAQHYYVEQEPPFLTPRMEAVARSYAFLANIRG